MEAYKAQRNSGIGNAFKFLHSSCTIRFLRNEIKSFLASTPLWPIWYTKKA